MTATATTPPPIQAPTAKEKKYDRQLRLWAASGQQALEQSHVLLVIADNDDDSSGSSVAGVETLKNLVLPSIGNFTIADSAKVTEADLGINFFLRPQSLGQSRAEECKQLLEELNPDVQGHAITTVCDPIIGLEIYLTHISHSPTCSSIGLASKATISSSSALLFRKKNAASSANTLNETQSPLFTSSPPVSTPPSPYNFHQSSQ